MGSLSRSSALRLVGYLGLALLITWPMAADPLGMVVGHPEASVGCHLWVLWWAQNYITELHTSLLFHPHGADVVQLYGSDVLSPLLLGRLPFPPALLYNFWVLTLLVAGAWGTDRLCRRLGATAAGAVLAGVVFESAPFFQHEILNGSTEMLAAAALPWFAWALLGVLASPSCRSGLLLGGVVGLGVAASAYNLFFMLLLGAVILLYPLATRMQPVLTRPVLRSLGWGAAVTLPVGIGLAWLHARHGGSELYERRSGFDDQGVVLPDSFASLEAWVDPRPVELPVLMPLADGSSFEYWTTCTVFLGLLSLSIGVYSVVLRRRLGPMGVTALVAGLIAMGPWLRIGGDPILLGEQPIALPSLVLIDLIPPFRVTALHAYRYAALVVLGLAVCVGQAWRWRPQVAAGTAVLIIIEAIFLSPVPWPAKVTLVPDSVTLRTLAAEPAGAVLQVPMRSDDLGELGSLLMAQTIHGHPVHDGGIHRRAGEESTALFQHLPALSLLSGIGARRIPDPVQSAWTLKELHSSGYRYVLVSAGDEAGGFWAFENLGSPLVEDDEWMLWTIETGSIEP